jgi:dihydroxyacetone kinase-like protein
VGLLMIEAQHVYSWLRRTADLIAENKDALTELDAAIGDADHGINMDRGYKKVSSQINTDQDITTLLKTAAMALISGVGGAGGPLYGTFFLRASTAVSGKKALGIRDLALLLEAGLNGVVERGQAQPGEKTMVDVLSPATVAFRKAAENGTTLRKALSSTLDAAEKGLKATIPMQARKGRASYLGERSIGHQDPGATSSLLLLKGLYETLSEISG